MLFRSFFIEGLRTDSLMWGSFRVSQMLALVLFAGSLLILAVQELRRRKAPETFVLFADTEESRERMAQVDAELAKEKNKGSNLPIGEGTREDSSEDGDALIEASEDAGEADAAEAPAPREDSSEDGGALIEASEDAAEVDAAEAPRHPEPEKENHQP